MAEVRVESFKNMNFEFDIEANRRRRAEIANDVNELINISKFFLQQYSDDSSGRISLNIPITKSIKKCEKNPSNGKKVQNQTIRNGRPACNQIKKPAVANVTPTLVKRKQKTYGMTPRGFIADAYDVMPPLFDKIKLHEYCVDIVDRFFHGTPNNECETSAKPTNERRQPNTANGKGMCKKRVKTLEKSNENSIKMKKNPKYASISARYMNPIPQIMAIQSSPKTTSPKTLLSTKSRQILEKKARTGIEVKKHSCLLKEKVDLVSKPQTKRITNNFPPMATFNQIHPNIALVPSNSMFPKRIIKEEMSHENKSIVSTAVEDDGTDRMGTSIEHDEEIDEIVEKEQQANKPNTQTISVLDNNNNGIHLQLQPLPALSIKAIPKCEIENLFEIEIKPKSPKTDGKFEWNNKRVVEFVHELSGGELLLYDKIKVKDNLGSRQKAMTSSVSIASGQPNRYLESFDQRNGLSVVNVETTTTENRITTDDTYDRSYIESGPSLNLSTISHMTDDEKFHSDQKLHSQMIDLRKSVKISAQKVIDEILENDSSSADPEKSLSTYNFDDLRQILQKIRDDKTALDLVTPKANLPLDLGAVGCDQQSTLTPRRSQSTQCDYLPTDSLHTNKTESEPIKYRIIDMPEPNAHLLKSPKFQKTITSICSSARRLDFNESLYKTATQEQITRAANKFLASILKNGNHSQSDDKRSSINFLRTKKPKYQIVDDQIINSDFSHAIDFGESTENTTSASELLSLKMRLNLVSDSCRSSHSQTFSPPNNKNVWDDRSDSNDFTSGSIDRQLRDDCHEIQYLSDLSDGEIPSEGEIFIRPN